MISSFAFEKLDLRVPVACLCLLSLGAPAYVGCGQVPEPGLAPGQTSGPSGEPDTVQEVMTQWLECEECEAGELEALKDAVTKERTIALPILLAALREGPPAENREQEEKALQQRYDELVSYSESHPEAKPPVGKEEFVRLYLSNYEASYRIRAAQALAEIGGPEARQAIEEALKRGDPRNDVMRVLQESLKKLQ